MTSMKLDKWELRDPGALLEEVAHRHALHPGLVVSALVEHASTSQRLVATEVVYDDERPPLPEQHREFVGPALQRLPIPEWTPDHPPAEHTVALVIARRGRVVFTSQEVRWGYGLLYGKDLLHVFTGDLLLVTEHGWRSMDDDLAGRKPALAA
jgi:hypothetical protein